MDCRPLGNYLPRPLQVLRTAHGRNIAARELAHYPTDEIGKPYSTCCTSGGRLVVWPETTCQPLGVLT